MKSVKRILALWLVMALLLGMLPAGAEQIAPSEAQIAVEAVPDDGTELGSEEPEVLEQEPLGAADESAGAVPEEEAIPENPGFLMDGDTLVVYEGPGGDVVVPEGVKVIGPVAFCQLPELRSVELPESVERIGSYAFADCENLEEVALPEGLKAIGDHAFQNCPKLKGLALPEDLESIGDEAFQGCDALGEVAIPAGAEVAEESALPEQVVAEPEADIPPVEGVELDAEAVEGQPAALEDEGGFRIVNPVEAIGVKENYTLKASLEDEGNVWTSDNEKYVKVVNSATGEIRGAKKGKATITVTAADGQTASTVVQVLSAPSKVSLSAKKGTLGVNETVQLTAKLPKKTASQSITWTSNHPEIAKVEGGLVTAVSAGKAKITAQTFNKKKASYTVTVKAEPEQIDVREALTLSKGQRYALNISLTPSTAAGKVKITNTNQSALKLDKTEFTVSGKASIKLTALAEGSATLRFELYNGLTAECEVKVCAVPTTLKIVNAVSSLGVKEEYQLRAESNADASLMMHAKWKSSNKKIIAVDSATGKLTAKKKGTATISVTLPKGKKTIKKSAKIKVVSAASGIALNQTSAELKPGDTLQLTATVPKKTASQIYWSSDDEGVATVENGLVTAINGGEATITASTFNGHSASCAVTVLGSGENPPAANAPKAPSIRINGSAAGSAAVEVSGDVALSWSSAEAVDSYDVRVDGESGASVLRKSATTETSATIPESSLSFGETYTVRIAATRDGRTGEAAVARFRYVQSGDLEPIVISALTADQDSVQTGDPVVWTASVSGGVRPLTYDWEVYRSGALVYSERTTRQKLTYAPVRSGSYTVKVVVSDAASQTAEATSEALSASVHPTSPLEDFSFNVLNGTYCEITGYSGSDATVILPEEDGEGHIVQRIAGSAFKNNASLRGVVISDSVETMGGSAFYGCGDLRSVIGGAALTNIGDSAFYNCKSLVYLSFAETTATIGSSAFSGCTTMQTFKGWQGLKTIDSYAFSGCTGLTQVSLPEGLESIGRYAFSGCTSLERIHIPDSVTDMQSRVFNGCEKLREANYPKSIKTKWINNDYDTPYSGCPLLTSMVVPEGVTAIPSYMFYGMTSLENIELPETLETIGFEAFRSCTGLESIELPKGVTSIEGGAFSSCRGLTSIIIPSKVTEIPGSVFSGCTGLTQVSLPEGLESIGRYAFSGCTSLGRIHIPDSVTDMQSRVFNGCEKLREANYPKSIKTKWINNDYDTPYSGCPLLTSMVVPEGVTAIPSYMFYGMTSLENIELPETLETIAYRAFYNCTALRAVKIGGNVSNIDSSAFSGCDKTQLTFYGVAGSYAQTWAEENGYNFASSGSIYDFDPSELENRPEVLGISVNPTEIDVGGSVEVLVRCNEKTQSCMLYYRRQGSTAEPNFCRSATYATDSDGAHTFRIGLPLVYAGSYTFWAEAEANGAWSASKDELNVNVRVGAPQILEVTMNNDAVDIGGRVEFVARTLNATQIKMIVDETWEFAFPTTGEYTIFDHCFSNNGQRRVCFSVCGVDGVWTEPTEPIQLDVLNAEGDYAAMTTTKGIRNIEFKSPYGQITTDRVGDDEVDIYVQAGYFYSVVVETKLGAEDILIALNNEKLTFIDDSTLPEGAEPDLCYSDRDEGKITYYFSSNYFSTPGMNSLAIGQLVNEGGETKIIDQREYVIQVVEKDNHEHVWALPYYSDDDGAWMHSCRVAGCGRCEPYSSESCRHVWDRYYGSGDSPFAPDDGHLCTLCKQRISLIDTPIYFRKMCIYDAIAKKENALKDAKVRAYISIDLQDAGASPKRCWQIMDVLEQTKKDYRNLFLKMFLQTKMEFYYSGGRSNYSEENRTLYMSKNETDETFLTVFFHESGHAIDYCMGTEGAASCSGIGNDGWQWKIYWGLWHDVLDYVDETMRTVEGYKDLTDVDLTAIKTIVMHGSVTALRGDINDCIEYLSPMLEQLTAKQTAFYNRLMTELRNTLYAEVGLLSNQYGMKRFTNTVLVFDIMGGITNNMLYIGQGGHAEEAEYWYEGNDMLHPTYRQNREAFACYFASKILGYEFAASKNEQYFSQGCKELGELLDSMCLKVR